MSQRGSLDDSENRTISENRNDDSGFEKLQPRSNSDTMRLYPHVLEELDNYFSMRGLTYLPGQRELLAKATEAVLQAVPGTATAIPFQPGLGKSTQIRALLTVFSQEFSLNTSIAQNIGGVIVVVEKTAEAEELEQLCNKFNPDRIIAKAISAPNDYNLAQGKCLNGAATTYQECLGRNCPDYADCPLVQSASQIHDTPILIMLHARYQRYMEDMSLFLTWEDSNGQHNRTLLLVDELPPMIEENALNLEAINQIETQFDKLKPSYQAHILKEKTALLCEWNKSIRTPFFKLLKIARKYAGLYGIISERDMTEAGFTPEKLQLLQAMAANYVGTERHASVQLINTLLNSENAYYIVGQDVSFFFPRLRKIQGDSQPATFLFSGTALLSPELLRNPDICTFQHQNLESFQRLTINIQRGDQFNSSKSGMAKRQNLSALTAWLQFILPQIVCQHNRVLVVTYKSFAEFLWLSLRDFHTVLIPYIGPDGCPKPMLPYFGGMNGSNLYRESTCVICVGLNRFEPRDYISRALALDFDGTHRDEINTMLEVQEYNVRLDSIPCVMAMQDITLARDIVQLVFRSALRNHGETKTIELWLLQPPNGVIQHLKDYFVDCQIQEFSELPEDCQLAAAAGRTYMGKQTHAGKLLEFLSKWDGKSTLTPDKIRKVLGLTLGQFKEAKKHKVVQDYFRKYIQTTGSGKNTVYSKMQPDSVEAGNNICA